MVHDHHPADPAPLTRLMASTRPRAGFCPVSPRCGTASWRWWSATACRSQRRVNRGAETASDTVTTPNGRTNRDADDLGGGVVDHLQSKRGVQCCQLRWIGAIEQLSDVSESVDYFRAPSRASVLRPRFVLRAARCSLHPATAQCAAHHAFQGVRPFRCLCTALQLSARVLRVLQDRANRAALPSVREPVTILVRPTRRGTRNTITVQPFGDRPVAPAVEVIGEDPTHDICCFLIDCEYP